MTCIDGSNKGAGTSCGTNMVCNGSGDCGACTAGSACSGNPSPCKDGTTSCTTGATTCIDTASKGRRQQLRHEQGLQQRGSCVACTAGASCNTNPSVCKVGVTSCTTGARPASTARTTSPTVRLAARARRAWADKLTPADMCDGTGHA